MGKWENGTYGHPILISLASKFTSETETLSQLKRELSSLKFQAQVNSAALVFV